MSLKRSNVFEILEGAEEFPAVGLLGSRQTGKTTLSRLIFKNHAYVSLEDIGSRTAATIDPRTFLSSNRNSYGIIIDDFHYAPELLSYLQSEGLAKNKKGEFILCGPQNTYNEDLLKNCFGENISIHIIFPLSLQELSANYQLPNHIDELIFKGLYPAVHAQHEDICHYYRNLISTYIDKDVRLYGQVENVTTFHSFLTACARRVGQVINSTALALECGISDHTVRRWLDLLEEQGIIFLQKPYHTSFGKRLIKSPKLYFFDTGIICSLLKIEKQNVPNHPLKDAFFQTLIMSELWRWAVLSKKDIHVYFWRDKTEHEIECLIEHGNILIPLKIALSAQENFLNAFKYWSKLSDNHGNSYTVVSESKREENQLSWQYLQPLYKAIAH